MEKYKFSLLKINSILTYNDIIDLQIEDKPHGIVK